MTPWGILDYFFEFVPAAQKAESRGSYCFFNMASSSRWNRTSAAASSNQAQSNARGQEYQGSGKWCYWNTLIWWICSEKIRGNPRWQISNTIDITQWESFSILLWFQAPNRLVSGSRASEEEERAKFTYIDGSTQHETNWQTWNVHGRNSLDFALGN